MHVTTLDTPRLRLRPLSANDVDAYAELCADPEVMEYVGDHGALSQEDVWRQLAMLVGHWELRGFGSWAVEHWESGLFVGRVGLHYPLGWPDREIAWALARRFWGQGLAYEAASAVLGHAFSTLGWPRVISLITAANLRSVRLAKRLGAQLQDHTVVRGHAVEVYVLSREAWRAG